MDNITLKRNKLINMINSKQDIPEILIELRGYILNVMARDIPNIEYKHRLNLSYYIIDYFKEALKKGYMTTDNIYECIKKIMDAVSGFYVISNPGLFGDCSGCKIGFNFSSPFAIRNMKHVIFHELTHSITDLMSLDKGIYGYKELKKQSNFTISVNANNSIDPVITDYMVTFLREIIAEFAACDLAGTYQKEKTSTAIPGLFSDWLTPFNCSYQNLGYEFLQTLLKDNSQNEREVFKNFVIFAINNNTKDSSYILKVYEEKNPDTWKEDLHQISLILGELVTTHFLDANKIKRVRELMKKYTPVSRLINNNSSNLQQSVPMRSLEIRSNKPKSSSSESRRITIHRK